MDVVRDVLRSGVAAAREEAVKTLEEVREVMNMKL
jgi:tryptophanyl-tRNA synthetase